MSTAAVVGGTGLVGSHLVARLARDPRVSRVRSLTRRASGGDLIGVEETVIDFETLDESRPIACEVAFCALGTTLKVAGSRQAFRRVDHDYVAGFARAARAGGARRFVLVSSVGADPHSRNFYLSVKGDAEVAVLGTGFESVRIFRPGLLLGERNESRPVERLGAIGARLINPLLLGPLAKYRGVPASMVAAAMVVAANEQDSGARVHTWTAIRELAVRASD